MAVDDSCRVGSIDEVRGQMYFVLSLAQDSMCTASKLYDAMKDTAID